MASLVDTLIDVLDKEELQYRKLIELSSAKTQCIVTNDIEGLQKITDEEQLIVDKINAYDKDRMSTMKEIAKILNTDVSGLKLDNLISLLDRTPKEQKALAQVYDRLRDTLLQVKYLNERNEELLNSAKEMVEFNLNIIQAMRTAPETANYNRGAYNTGSTMGVSNSGFDAKQ